jgi:hypothetical protein
VTSDTISKFNRDTVWLTTGVLGTVVFAALVLVIQKCQPKAAQAQRDLLPKTDLHRAGSVLAESSGSNGKMTTGQGSSVDHAFTEHSIDGIPTSQTEPGATNPAIALPPVNRNDAQTNLDSGISARREDSARATGPRVRNARRSSLASRTIDVKRRLVELWHQSLAQIERSRSWTAFSNLKKGVNKKAAYNAETNH